ncbi:IstB-like ATP-binding domain-containing protein [Rhodothermus sp. AH-315-K08]|nr:IstB-like ATP-binding domain-containing protein [Rhodothermus sp. AH-315-K08]
MGHFRFLGNTAEDFDLDALTFDERLGFLVDREASGGESRKFSNRLRRARFNRQASLSPSIYEEHGGAHGADEWLRSATPLTKSVQNDAERWERVFG